MNEPIMKDIYIKGLEAEVKAKEKEIDDLKALLEQERQTVKSLRKAVG